MVWTAPPTFTDYTSVFAADLNTYLSNNLTALVGAWTAYTPTLTAATSNPTLGSGSAAVGRYSATAASAGSTNTKTISGFAKITFGSSGAAAGSGAYRISLPVAALTTNAPMPAGIGRIKCAGNTYIVYFEVDAGGTYGLLWTTASTAVSVTHAAPGAWTNNDFLYVQFDYEAA